MSFDSVWISAGTVRHHTLPLVAVLINVVLLQLCLAKLLSSQDENYRASPLRWFLSILIPLCMTAHGYRKRSISPSGALSGLVVGFSMVMGSYSLMAAVFICYLATSRATCYREDIKLQFESNFKKGGQRNWIQIVCNLGIANAFILVRLILFGVGEFSIDFNHRPATYWNSFLLVGAFSAVSCALGDTLSSELGPVWSTEDPMLITNFRQVPRGTNGGVTIAGLLAACLGGFLVGLFAFIGQSCFASSYPGGSLGHWSSPHQDDHWSPQWPILMFCLYAGLFGSLIDSVMGATLQYTGFNRLRGRIVESPPLADDHHKAYIEHISGRHLLDNHSVNLLSVLICSILVPYLAAWFWPSGSAI